MFLIMQRALQVTMYTAASNLTLEICREAKKEQGDSGCSYPAEGSREQYKKLWAFQNKSMALAGSFACKLHNTLKYEKTFF